MGYRPPAQSSPPVEQGRDPSCLRFKPRTWTVLLLGIARQAVSATSRTSTMDLCPSSAREISTFSSGYAVTNYPCSSPGTAACSCATAYSLSTSPPFTVPFRRCDAYSVRRVWSGRRRCENKRRYDNVAWLQVYVLGLESRATNFESTQMRATGAPVHAESMLPQAPTLTEGWYECQEAAEDGQQPTSTAASVALPCGNLHSQRRCMKMIRRMHGSTGMLQKAVRRRWGTCLCATSSSLLWAPLGSTAESLRAKL
jgi:hypothetical protein